VSRERLLLLWSAKRVAPLKGAALPKGARGITNYELRITKKGRGQEAPRQEVLENNSSFPVPKGFKAPLFDLCKTKNMYLTDAQRKKYHVPFIYGDSLGAYCLRPPASLRIV